MSEASTSGGTSPLIVTTALEATWDDSKGIVWAGEWCRRPVRRDVWEPLGGSIESSLWTPERVAHVADTTRSLRVTREVLVSVLGQRLAAIHGLPSDDRFWRIVLGAWAMFYVQELHDRFVTAQRLRAAHPDSPVTAPKSWRL